MLEDPVRLDRFLTDIFDKAQVKVSIKTRLGMERDEEWEALLDIYNKYPIEKLIVHARVRADFYQNTPNWDAFAKAVKCSRNPLCYNGDIFTVENYKELRKSFPSLESVMMGRGVIANPYLPGELRMADMEDTSEPKRDMARLQAFHDELYAGYQTILSGDRNLLFKMKELWHYMVHLWPDAEKHAKKLRKMNTCSEYEIYVKKMFGQLAS